MACSNLWSFRLLLIITMGRHGQFIRQSNYSQNHLSMKLYNFTAICVEFLNLINFYLGQKPNLKLRPIFDNLNTWELTNPLLVHSSSNLPIYPTFYCITLLPVFRNIGLEANVRSARKPSDPESESEAAQDLPRLSYTQFKVMFDVVP